MKKELSEAEIEFQKAVQHHAESQENNAVENLGEFLASLPKCWCAAVVGDVWREPLKNEIAKIGGYTEYIRGQEGEEWYSWRSEHNPSKGVAIIEVRSPSKLLTLIPTDVMKKLTSQFLHEGAKRS